MEIDKLYQMIYEICELGNELERCQVFKKRISKRSLDSDILRQKITDIDLKILNNNSTSNSNPESIGKIALNSTKKSLKISKKGKNSWKDEYGEILLEIGRTYRLDWKKIKTRLNKMLSLHLSAQSYRYKYNIYSQGKQLVKRKRFTHEEDFLIVEKANENGLKWELLTGYFPGRSVNSIKSRYYALVKSSA